MMTTAGGSAGSRTTAAVVTLMLLVALFREPFGIDLLVQAVIIRLTGGLIMGLLAWNGNERAYQDATAHAE